MPHEQIDILRSMGQRLRRLRLALGYKRVSGFSRDTGIDDDTLRLMEKGTRAISPVHARKLRDATRVSIDWLYFGDEKGLPFDLHQILRKAAAEEGEKP